MVNPESEVLPELVPSLDPELLSLSEEDMCFLRTVISPDDPKIRERILDVQRRYVHNFAVLPNKLTSFPEPSKDIHP